MAPVAVASFVAVHSAFADLDDTVGDTVEEVAVVRDEDHRAREPFQFVFEDLQRVYVEVVGRLVEDEAVRLSKHDQEQLQPGSLSPTQGCHRLPDLLVAKQEAPQQLYGVAFVDWFRVPHQPEW